MNEQQEINKFEITRDALLFDIKFKTLHCICTYGFK